MSVSPQLTACRRIAAAMLAVGAAAALSACAATPSGQAADRRTAATTRQPAAHTPEAQAAHDLLKRYKEHMQVDAERRRFLADSRFQLGKSLFDHGDFSAARKQFERALELHPHHKPAQIYLKKARSLLGVKAGPVGASFEMYAGAMSVAIEMRKRELANELHNAKALYAQGRYAEALEAFMRVSAKAKHLAPRLDVAKAAEEAQVSIQRCREAIDAQRRKDAEERQRQAREEAERLRKRRLGLAGERHRALLGQARALLGQRRYDAAAKVCDSILAQDPANGAAEALRARATEASRNAAIDKALSERKVELARHWNHSRALCVPQFALLSISPERLAELRHRVDPLAIGDARKPEPEWEKRIREAMGKRISFDFVETPLQDVVSFLTSLTGVTIVLDAEAVKDAAPTVTLRVNDMRLEKALGWVCKLVGLTYGLRDEAIYISNRLQETPELRMYHVSDITVSIQNFKGNQRALCTDTGHGAGDSGGASTLSDFFEKPEDDDKEVLTGQKLVDFIRRTIAPGTWRKDGPEGIGVVEEY